MVFIPFFSAVVAAAAFLFASAPVVRGFTAEPALTKPVGTGHMLAILRIFAEIQKPESQYLPDRRSAYFRIIELGAAMPALFFVDRVKIAAFITFIPF
jgi:hypothetical protein